MNWNEAANDEDAGPALGAGEVQLGAKVVPAATSESGIGEEEAPVAAPVPTTLEGEDPAAAPAPDPEADGGADASGEPSPKPESADLIPSDPLFASQWHLRNNVPGLLDLNVIDVWNDYSGAGVDVAVIDDGVQRNHPDLDGNYSTAKDWDFQGNDTDPSPGGNIFFEDDHGTATTGIIGANAGNGIGGVGVAYDSTIFGFRVHSLINDIFIEQLTDAVDNASGLQQQSGVDRSADVVNMSLGTQTPNNFFDQDLDPALMADLDRAIDDAAQFGRGGLGTILVKSAGNSRNLEVDGNVGHDGNAESWNANPHTISVAAVDQDGFVSSYSTYGANILVSGFGTPGEVVTTDRTGADGYDPGDYTFGFNGTSAAAPMVSGVVALMLEANPDLGWRDVQEILAYSARHVGSAVGTGISGDEKYPWQFNGASNWNGGGLHFSNDYGFGLVDAKAAVRLAETWGDTPKTSFNDSPLTVDVLNTAITLTPFGTFTDITFNPFLNVAIEYVEIDVSFLRWDDLGDLNIRLISPDGSTSVLIDDAGENDGSPDGGFGAGRWQFYTHQFRGETTGGNWTLRLYDTDASSTTPIQIDDIDITFYGSIGTHDETFIFTEEFSDYDGLFGHSTNIAGGAGIDTINAAAVDSSTHLDLLAGLGTIDGVGVTISGIENVHTGDGHDFVREGGAIAVANTISTHRGNDMVVKTQATGAIIDTFDGGDGTDTFVLQGASFGASHAIDLGKGRITFGGQNHDILIGFENARAENTAAELIGNSKNNLLTAIGDFDNKLSGGVGVDTLFGGDGDDTLYGGFDEDYCYGGAGNDTIIVENGHFFDNVYGGTGIDTLDHSGVTRSGDIFDFKAGKIVSDFLVGPDADLLGIEIYRDGSGGNTIRSSGTGGSYYGGGGDDVMVGSTGAETMDGGAGIDLIDLSARTEALSIDLAALPSKAGAAPYTGFERLTSGGGSDRILGTGSANIISGNGGADVIDGLAGADLIDGGEGHDSLVGGEGTDWLLGGIGNDTLDGGLGNDTLSDGTGADILSGGGGANLFDLVVDGAEDVILDFVDGLDQIRLAGLNFAALSFTDVAAGEVRIGYAGDTLLVTDRSGLLTSAGFSTADFLFA